VQPIARSCIGADAAKPKTIDGLQVHALARLSFGRSSQGFNASRLASFGAAKFDNRPGIMSGLEIMIEADDTVHSGTAQVERLGNRRLCMGINAAERRLNVVQYWQQRAPAPGMGVYDLGKTGFLHVQS
jgi:hypothetical protein